MHAIIQGQENERKRLSKDLHDSLIQQLSAAKFHINSTLHVVKSKKIKPALNASNKILADVIQDVRTICFNLVPPSLQEFGLLKAIKEYASRYNKFTKLDIVRNNPLPVISMELQHDLFRIAQEFISNAVKHGIANKIKLIFSYENHLLKIIFSDNGKGFDTQKKSDGMGLRNMHGRIKSHNGVIKITSQPGKGTSVKILIPTHKQIWPSFKL